MTTRNKIRGFIGVKSNDGHDAAILVVADGLKKGGVEVILGGYDITIHKFVEAIVQEGVHFAGISSYNGGHIPFFIGVRDALKQRGCPHIHIIGGGGATITPEDIEFLEREPGIDRIFKSGEGPQIVPYIREHYDFSVVPEHPEESIEDLRCADTLAVSGWLNLAEEKARLESLIDEKKVSLDLASSLRKGNEFLNEPVDPAGTTVREVLGKIESCAAAMSRLDPLDKNRPTTVYGITGRGGAGKSTLTDELILRFFHDQRNQGKRVALLAVDPSSHRSGGALLADRVAYMYATDKNWVDTGRIFIRSVAARGFGNGIARALPDMIKILTAAGYDIFIESYGTGQPDTGIARLVDKPVYVTTPDIGGASQIGKEEMLNVPGVYVVLNKNELRGARHVSGLLRGKINGNRLFLTTAIEHKNPGVDKLYRALTEHYR
ncbi:MAG: cobalamin-dependent protein [Nitrospinaceae bacterium]